MDLIELN